MKKYLFLLFLLILSTNIYSTIQKGWTVSVQLKPQIPIHADAKIDNRVYTYENFMQDLPDRRESALVSGNHGFLIYQRAGGSWGLEISGSKHLLYRPSAVIQNLYDGKKHLILICADESKNTLKIYFDSRNTAIYSLPSHQLLKLNEHKLKNLAPNLVESIQFKDKCMNTSEIMTVYNSFNPKWSSLKEQFPAEGNFKVMTFNIWHGGVGDCEDFVYAKGGSYEGLRPLVPSESIYRIAEVIKSSNAKVVMLQETYGSGEILADILGYTYIVDEFPAWNNLSILSAYPVETILKNIPSHLLAVRIRLAENKTAIFCSTWIDWRPDIWSAGFYNGNNAISIIKGEKPRVDDMKRILSSLKPWIKDSDEPVILCGDHNSPSLLDYTTETVNAGLYPLEVKWPVSQMLIENGFKDSFRDIHPSALAFPAQTWTPRYPNDGSQKDRIDYIYYLPYGIIAVDSEMICEYTSSFLPEYRFFPSDHAAVVTEFEIRQP